MKKRTLFLFILAGCFAQISWAVSSIQQEETAIHFAGYASKDVALVTGFQTGSYNFVEIGLGIKKDIVYHHFFTSVLMISNEFKYNDRFVWGFKMGGWFSGGANPSLGINLVNYTNFKENSVQFRPEIGFGFGKFRMYYGRNMALINKEFPERNKHLFGLTFLLDVKNIKREELPK